MLTAHQLAYVMHEAAFSHQRFSVQATRAAMARANGRRNLGVLEKALALARAGSAVTGAHSKDRFMALVQRVAGAPA